MTDFPADFTTRDPDGARLLRGVLGDRRAAPVPSWSGPRPAGAERPRSAEPAPARTRPGRPDRPAPRPTRLALSGLAV